MNGIVHNCTHGDSPAVDLKAAAALPKPLTESEIFAKIFKYIDKLFHMVKPKKLLFMAIDGVAPRAKMNQQRQRRFRSAMEAREALVCGSAACLCLSNSPLTLEIVFFLMRRNNTNTNNRRKRKRGASDRTRKIVGIQTVSHRVQNLCSNCLNTSNISYVKK